MRAGVSLAAMLALGGCSLAPDYRRPTLAMTPAFKELPAGWRAAEPQAHAPVDNWWRAIGDPVLNALQDRLERGSPTLAAAVARYDQARATLGQLRAQSVPEIDFGTSVSAQRQSAYRPIPMGAQTPEPLRYNDVRLGPSLLFELDVFGRVRNSIRAGRANAEASAADIRSVRLGLQAALATTYIALRGAEARQVLLEQTGAAFQRALDLVRARHEGGAASGVDLARAEAQLRSASAELAGLPGERAGYEHAIAVLLGEVPSGFTLPRAPALPPAPQLIAGTPSDLLQRRPDIDAAERRVFAANASIGVARAALFPSFQIGGTAGVESTGRDILSAPAVFWAVGPLAITQALFDGGRRRAGVRLARAQFDEAAATYRQTVLTAVREVEDGLAAASALGNQTREQAAAAAAARRTPHARSGAGALQGRRGRLSGGGDRANRRARRRTRADRAADEPVAQRDRHRARARRRHPRRAVSRVRL